MTQILTRSEVEVPLLDGSDPVQVIAFMRNLGFWCEYNAAMYLTGTDAARPAASKVGRLYKPTDVGLESVVYWDTGSVWRTIGGSAPSDPAAGTPGLRTLGSGSTQAAAGDHTHSGTSADDVQVLTLMGAL